MITNKINENKYSVTIYDWTENHDDYICGHVCRDIDADEESDLRYWLFYPTGGIVPMNAGDLRSIYMFIAELNTNKE